MIPVRYPACIDLICRCHPNFSLRATVGACCAPFCIREDSYLLKIQGTVVATAGIGQSMPSGCGAGLDYSPARISPTWIPTSLPFTLLSIKAWSVQHCTCSFSTISPSDRKHMCASPLQCQLPSNILLTRASCLQTVLTKHINQTDLIFHLSSNILHRHYVQNSRPFWGRKHWSGLRC